MFPVVNKLVEKVDFITKLMMTFSVMFPFLHGLMLWFPPMTHKGWWLISIGLLVGKLYPVVTTVWIFQTVFIQKIYGLFFRLTEKQTVEREIQGVPETHLKNVHTDVTKKARMLLDKETFMHTTSVRTWNAYMSYVRHALSRTQYYSTEGDPLDEINNWSGRLVVVMHSNMHVYFVIKMTLLVPVYAFLYADEWIHSFEQLNMWKDDRVTFLGAYYDKKFMDHVLVTCVKNGLCVV